MKPTVIATGNQGDTNPAPVNNSGTQPTANTGNQQHQPDGGARNFPNFQSGFGFGPHFDDMFADDDFGPSLRARMHPFTSFGGRFHDPEWETMRGSRRRPQATGGGSQRSGNIFDHIPAQFRSYIPDDFGFDQSDEQPFQQGPTQQRQQQPQYRQQAPTPQQYYQEPPQQQQYYQQQQPPSRPKYCDASIQTDNDVNDRADSQMGQNLNQHNLRNTCDLGQKSQQEASNESRSHSAPPINDPSQNFPSASEQAGHGRHDCSTDPRSPQQGFVPQQRAYPNNPPTPPQRHYVPPQYQNQPQYQQYPQQQQQPSPQQQKQQQAPQQDAGGFVRTVPIFVEGRQEPIFTARRRQPQQQATPSQFQQQQPHPQQQQSYPQPQQHPQQQPYAQQQQQEQHQQQRPTPLNTQQAQAYAEEPPQAEFGPGETPQTPHTAASITKIQNIQSDVLDLLGKVEHFTGTKKDKEYIYLDEMLTRNLLKLDTIDTNGKDNIRLARREAIKCIQASINVLEAKAEENAKTAQGAVIQQDELNYQNLEQGQCNIAVPVDAQPAETSEVLTQPAVSKDKSKSPEPITETATGQSIESQSEAIQPTTEENTDTLAAPESIDKSNSEKENQPPGSPKKKMVRKVKKKVPTPPGAASSDESSAVTPPNKEAETNENSEQSAETAIVEDSENKP